MQYLPIHLHLTCSGLIKLRVHYLTSLLFSPLCFSSFNSVSLSPCLDLVKIRYFSKIVYEKVFQFACVTRNEMCTLLVWKRLRVEVHRDMYTLSLAICPNLLVRNFDGILSVHQNLLLCSNVVCMVRCPL